MNKEEHSITWVRNPYAQKVLFRVVQWIVDITANFGQRYTGMGSLFVNFDYGLHSLAYFEDLCYILVVLY